MKRIALAIFMVCALSACGDEELCSEPLNHFSSCTEDFLKTNNEQDTDYPYDFETEHDDMFDYEGLFS